MDLENDVKRATEDFPDTVERLPPLNYSSAAPTKSRIPVPIREKPPSPGPGRFEGTYSKYINLFRFHKIEKPKLYSDWCFYIFGKNQNRKSFQC